MATQTTAAGTPVTDNQNSESAGPRGPLLMQDYRLMEKMAYFNRERVPERVVHAKGAGVTAAGRTATTQGRGLGPWCGLLPLHTLDAEGRRIPLRFDKDTLP